MVPIMRRRHFLASLAAPAVIRAAPRAPVRITAIRLAPIEGRFHKFVSMNSYDTAPKGHTYTNTLVRIATDQGIEGVGVASGAADRVFQDAVRALIGADPLSLYETRAGRIAGRAPAHARLLARYMHLDGPLFDLIGKLNGVPCWKLIGESARDRIEVYDGTLYFADVWFRDRGVKAVMEEAEEALRRGYTGLKFKAGRGSKWMEKDAGLARDVEVLKAARKLAGPRIKILADPNDGYRGDFDRAWRFLSESRAVNLHWIEEIFPENVNDYARLKDRMEAAGMKTLVAEGESFRDPAGFAPYLKPRRVIDVLQMDIRHGGFLGNLEMARMGEEAGAISVPHNWASQTGLFMALQMAKAVRSVPAAEDDRSTCDVLAAEGYQFRGGYYTVPDAPGMGIQVNERVYREKYQAREVVLS